MRIIWEHIIALLPTHLRQNRRIINKWRRGDQAVLCAVDTVEAYVLIGAGKLTCSVEMGEAFASGCICVCVGEGGDR
jgi:hypothetical protein